MYAFKTFERFSMAKVLDVTKVKAINQRSDHSGFLNHFKEFKHFPYGRK